MTLERQLQALIQDAPQEPQMQQMVRAIGVAIQSVAQPLRHLQYYVAQTPSQEWLRTILVHPTQSDVEKTVVYAFSTQEDTLSGSDSQIDHHLSAVAVPVLDLLFQVWTLNLCDSVVFLEIPGNTTQGREVSREAITQALSVHLKAGDSPQNWA